MTYAENRNRLLRCIIALIAVVCTLFGAIQPTAVFAAGNEVSFENSNVLDDLKSSTANGKPFDIKQYPFDEEKDAQILSFTEYCYSYKANKRDRYALYVYVYNPKGLNISTTSKSNKIQMATEYDESGIPTRYEKFTLIFCSKVESGDNKNLFYKFKIEDKKIDGKTFADRVISAERRYDVSGIELLTVGQKNAKEYGVGGSFIFTGYAEGYGPDEKASSTLNCTVENIETLELTVHHTNFRTNVSSLGKDHYNEVNTVYFSVPERVYEQYGYLQKIRAEWWEYKTKMAVITSNEDFYNQLLLYNGTDVGVNDKTVPVWLYSGYSGQTGSPAIHNYAWVYNKDLTDKKNAFGVITDVYFTEKQSSILPLAFYSPKVDLDSVFKFLYSDPIAGDVSSTAVKEYIYNYKNSLGNGYIDCNGREISVDLFESYVDEGRTMGYNDKTIDLSDTFDLNSYDSTHNWWDKLWDYGFSWPATNGDYKDVAPIYEIKASDLSGSDKEISERLLVNSDDVMGLKEFYEKETKAGSRVILFRFANTDYYSAPAFTPNTTSINDTDAYVAQQTVFFDFDIIELTFNKDGEYRIIPAVSSPTDIINGFTAPAEELQLWRLILGLLFVVLLVLFLSPALPYVISLIVFVTFLPFKLLSLLFKAVKKKRNKED